MKEELYVFRNGAKLGLDLNSPSGITLNYVNNLFNDLSKLSASYTYTFKLPLTESNRIALDIIDDIRHEDGIVKRKLQAEYLQNGIALSKKCNLYIDSVSEGCINCCFTWGVVDGLEELSKHDRPLNELKGDPNYRHYEWDSDYDFTHEQDEYVTLIDEFDSYIPENFRKGVAYPYYNAGVDNNPACIAIDRFSYPVTRDSKGAIPEAPLHAQIYGVSKSESAYTMPAPVVKVSKIIKRINDTYGINLRFGGDFYHSLYLPLVSLNKSEGLLRQVSITGTSGFMFDYIYGFLSGTDAMLVYYDTAVIHSNISSNEGIELVQTEVATAYVSPPDPPRTVYAFHITDGHFVSLVLDGYVDFEIDLSGMSHPFPSPFEAHLELRRYDTNSFGETIMNVSKDITTGVVRFDFRKEYGYENAASDRFYTSFPFGFTVSVDGVDGAYLSSHVRVADLSNLKVYVKRGAGDINYRTNLYMNLPDISCMDFVKSLYYIIGGFPCIDENGNILVRFYTDITENLIEGNALDWTDKLLYPNDKKLDLKFKGDSLSTLAQNNYYLMANDEIDGYGNPTPPYKYGEDRYEHSYMNIRVDNELLPIAETVIKLPYSGRFLANKKATALYTGRTTDLWKCDGEQVSGGEGAKAMIGTLALQETWHDASETYPEYSTDNEQEPQVVSETTIFKLQRGGIMLGFKVWQLPESVADDPRYNVLAAVFNRPYEVVEYMNLSELDLQKLDYANPVYLGQYNSYFIISKIERTSDGISKVYFMRLDISALNLNAARQRQSEQHILSLKCDLIMADNLPNQTEASSSMYGVLPNSATTMYVNYTAGAAIHIPNYNFYEYAFYDGEQVVPDTVTKNLYVDGALYNSDTVTFHSGMTITREAIITYMGMVARWKRTIVYKHISELTDPVVDWGIVCNRPYTFLRVQDGDTVKASELGLNYVEINVRCDHPTLGHRTAGMLMYSNAGRFFYTTRLVPERDCQITLYALDYARGNVISYIEINYVYDIDIYEHPEISVGDAIWSSTHMDSDEYITP